MGTKKGKLMKVLYAAHFRESSGWSQASLDYALALDSLGVVVVCRSIKINNSKPELPKRYLELESKSLDGVDICVQHVLPHYMNYNSKVKNVGLFVMESSTCAYSSWAAKLRQMDRVIVPNRQMAFNVGC